ncbi:hypothetical protein CWO90_41075 [Bradyrhizobium sp. Leo121]|nr:hypothetical protein CWO90_41075 [Bradyrhizobium sp. Leo121]
MTSPPEMQANELNNLELRFAFWQAHAPASQSNLDETIAIPAGVLATPVARRKAPFIGHAALANRRRECHVIDLRIKDFVID